MFRSNPIACAGGVLFIGALALAFVWAHDFPRAIRVWGAEAWLVAAAGVGFFLWLHGMRLRALVNGIPTSRIASAPQGYVELSGRAAHARRHVPGGPESCLWKRTQFASRMQARGVFPFNLFYVVHNVDVTDHPFMIEDGSGEALVLPAGAEVICARRRVEYDGDRKTIREHILEGDPLYVLGNLTTTRHEVDVATLTERTINDWKMDNARFRDFDTNRDGYLWGRELLEMHRAAREAAEWASATAAAEESVHVVAAAGPDRRFLIATLPADRIAGHYHWYLGVGLALFLGSLAAALAWHRAFLTNQ
jgi:hypothetical protein